MKKNDIIIVGKGVLTIFVFAAIIFGVWLLKREVNYNLLYEAKVKNNICEMVKKEYLKEGVCP